MPPEERPAGARPTRQARSKATLDRLLDAVGALLAERPLEEVSVAEIARRAGSSVGAVYGRFPDKESLLSCFDERFFEQARAAWDEFFDAPAWREASLPDAVARLVCLLVRTHGRHRGVLRALALRVRERLEPSFRERALRHNQYVLERIKADLLSRPGSVCHPHPARAVELGFLFAVSAVREAVLFEDVGGLAAPSDEELTTELTRAFLAYLGAGQRARTPGSQHP
jgi:AcrR family transcriptional regulator